MKNNIKACNMEKPFVFVSYSKQDAAKVYPLIEELQSLGCNIWIDKELNKTVGEDWQAGALGALRHYNCKAVLYFMSCNSLWSAPVCAELLFSASETVQDNNNNNPLKIIPINSSDSWTPQEQNFQDLVYSGEANSSPYANEPLSASDYEVLRAVDVDDKYLDKSRPTVYQQHKDIAKHIYKNAFGPKPDQITIASIQDLDTIKQNIPTEVFGQPSNTVAHATVPISPEPAVAPASAPVTDTTNTDSNTAPAPKKPSSTTGDITFTLYGKEYTMNQSDMMLAFFAQVLNKHQEVIHEVESYKGMNCVSTIDYTKKENRTESMPSYFRICQYFTFGNGESLCVGTAYSIADKLKKMANLLNICGEDSEIFHSEQVTLPVVKKSSEKGNSSKGNSSSVNFSIFGNSFSMNQSNMLGIICSTLLKKHPNKLSEAADTLLCIDLKDYTNVAKEDRPVYFGSMNQYYEGTTPYCVGGSFGMKEKLKMISRLLQICEEDPQCIFIDGYELPVVSSYKSTTKKETINYFG
ncbi:MAG: toll/interleukin-1 receptor domain-containing protein [Lachnospiraceae bacterium]|nr:toll/interleukin-1 receptor domain-containing protein [Lachnospiraceae bacterium]